VSAASAPLAHVPVSTLAAYGLFGMPLAMAALPLYVHLPKFYGDYLGVNLALLGGVLLALRLADGVIDRCSACFPIEAVLASAGCCSRHRCLRSE
jgi:Na+/melibiose symporter-like transporter